MTPEQYVQLRDRIAKLNASAIVLVRRMSDAVDHFEKAGGDDPRLAAPSTRAIALQAVEATIEAKAEAHNAKSARKCSSKTLKKVYRRGVSAFKPSAGAGMSEGAYAMQRVNAFLKSLRSDKPDPKHPDADLLAEDGEQE